MRSSTFNNKHSNKAALQKYRYRSSSSRYNDNSSMEELPENLEKARSMCNRGLDKNLIQFMAAVFGTYKSIENPGDVIHCSSNVRRKLRFAWVSN